MLPTTEGQSEGVNFYVLNADVQSMTREENVSRRTVLKLGGAAASTAIVAGCLGNGDDDETVDPDDWEDVEEIELEGTAQEWIGASPGHIDGESNPTLVLFEGNEYEITWENADDLPHDFQIRDDDDTVLEETERVETEGETASVTFEATEEMTTYICSFHEADQVGDIQIE